MNDLSIHGQFPDAMAFKAAIGRVMQIRALARRFGREVHCHRNVASAQVTHNQILPQVVQLFGADEKRSVMQWLTRLGPFWEDDQVHSADDYLECDGEVVTDTAVGEAAFCRLGGLDRRLVSLAPSVWTRSPLVVRLMADGSDVRETDVLNHWDVGDVKAALRAVPTALDSWGELEAAARARFERLTISDDCFEPLSGHPFVSGAADRILVLLDVLDRLGDAFDASGKRTAEGDRLYRDHFTGGKAWFSDSSATEKVEFETDLTFGTPSGERIFCPWHGKVKWPQIRIHFSWPIRKSEPIHVVYVGPKITKS